MSRNDPQLVLSCIVAEDNEPVFPELREKTEQKYSQQLIRGLTLRQLLGREPIRLGIVESRILRFLAKRPYYPFTRRKIAQAVTSPSQPVTEEMVDSYIRSLRDQLGFFHDYVQTVPASGYQFKA